MVQFPGKPRSNYFPSYTFGETPTRWFKKNPRLAVIHIFCDGANWLFEPGPAGAEHRKIGLDYLDEDEWFRYQEDSH